MVLIRVQHCSSSSPAFQIFLEIKVERARLIWVLVLQVLSAQSWSGPTTVHRAKVCGNLLLEIVLPIELGFISLGLVIEIS